MLDTVLNAGDTAGNKNNHEVIYIYFFFPVFPLSFIWADPWTEGLHLEFIF